MSEKNVIFNNKKIYKNNSYRIKKLSKIDDTDINKILVCKREPYDKKAHLNTLLDIIIMTLDHYL